MAPRVGGGRCPTVALTYVLARLVIPEVLPRAAAAGATFPAGLLALDVLHLVQSRIAMLDVFLALFVVAAFVAVALDLSAAPRPERGGIGPWLFGRPWRLLAGVLIGCAVAVKWSGAYSGPGSSSSSSAGRSSQENRRLGSAPQLVVGIRGRVPGRGAQDSRTAGVRTSLVYVLTYAGVAEGSLLAAPWREGSWLYDVAHHQVAMARFPRGPGWPSPV